MSNNNGETEKFPIFNLSVVDESEQEAERDLKIALEIYPAISSAIALLERALGASREARERPKFIEEVGKAKSFLADQQLHKTPVIRRAVWKALLGFEFSKPLATRKEAEKLLADMVQRGLLMVNPGGNLAAYGTRYEVSPVSCFGDPERVDTKKGLEEFLGRVKRGMLFQGTISLEELKAGQAGQCVLEAPAVKETGKDGGPVRRGGGVLVVKSDGFYIQPEEAMGAIEGGVQEAINLGVRVPVNSLRLQKPPFFENPNRDVVRKQFMLWNLIKRAEQLERERKKFPTMATITPQEFLLEGKLGTCLIDLGQTVWEVVDRDKKVADRLHSIFFLVERREEEGTKRLRIKEVPTHLVDFFGSCTAEYEEGNRFMGCPQPLQAVLQATFRQTFKNTEKAGQVVTAA